MNTVHIVFYAYHDAYEFIGVFKNKRAALKGKEEYLDGMEPYKSETFNRSFYRRNTFISREKVRT